MSSPNVKNYKDYVEVVNGLFTVDKVMFEIGLDDPEEFTFRQGVQIIPRETTGIINQLEQYQPAEYNTTLTRQDIEEAVHSVFEERPMIFVTGGEEGYSDFSRALLEESRRLSAQSIPTRFYNMSEEELINHFDRISQEE